jgi:hypothetical protein
MAPQWINTRRQFLQKSGLGVLGASIATRFGWASQEAAAPPVAPRAVIAALGDTLIPTEEPAYPGYRRLESRGISEHVWNILRRVERVTAADVQAFNNGPQPTLAKTFLELDAAQRNAYLETIAGSPDTVAPSVRKVFELGRKQVFTAFYRNFPFHTVDRDGDGVPIPTDAAHQIVHLGNGADQTGWDVAGFRGSLSWTEEEERRARFMKIHWHDDRAPRV